VQRLNYTAKVLCEVADKGHLNVPLKTIICLSNAMALPDIAVSLKNLTVKLVLRTMISVSLFPMNLQSMNSMF